MATVIEIPCPECDRILKVPESAFGKKVKCKYCGAKIEVEELDLDELDDDEDERPRKKGKEKTKKPAVKASKPGGAVKPKKEESAPKKDEPEPAASTYQYDEDEGEGGAALRALGVVYEGEDVPRCPHCAQELDPPDAVVCIHCGFNNVTRTKADSKKVWAPGAEDYFYHLLPGILALIGCIGLIVLNIVCYLNMRDWMTDTFLQKDEKDAQGEIAFYVKPGAFITFIIAATIMPIIGFGRFAIKRLIINNQPEEKVKK
jgi:DNA-directed RNA polymerase subunit M/transcription elongation factor TFIIS